MTGQQNCLFVIDSHNKYKVTINQIKDIEEAGDDFVTYDEAIEVLGLDDGDYIACGDRIRETAVTEALVALRAEAKEKKQKTILITEQDLLDTLTNYYRSVSYFLPGTRRAGARLSFQGSDAAEKKKLRSKHHSIFMWLICRAQDAFAKKNKFSFDLKYANLDYHGSLTFCKNLVEWSDMPEGMDKFWMPHPDTFEIAKQMWDNLEEFFPKKEEVKEETPT